MQKWNLVSRHARPLPRLFSLCFYHVSKLSSSFKSPATCSVAWVLCHCSYVVWGPACISSCFRKMKYRLLYFIRWGWLSCQNEWGDHFVSPTRLCVTCVHSDSLYSGLGKSWGCLFYLALIIVAPTVQVLDRKIRSGQHSQGASNLKRSSSSDMPAENHAHPWPPSLSFPSGHTLFNSSVICLFQLLHTLTFWVCITLHSPPFFG